MEDKKIRLTDEVLEALVKQALEYKRLVQEHGEPLRPWKEGCISWPRMCELQEYNCWTGEEEQHWQECEACRQAFDRIRQFMTEPDKRQTEDAFVQPAASAAKGWVWSEESAVAVDSLRFAPSAVEKGSLRLVDREHDIAVTVLQDGGRLHATVSTDRDDLVGRVVEVQVVPDDVDSEASPLSATVELAAADGGGCKGSADLGEAPRWKFRLGFSLIPKTDG